MATRLGFKMPIIQVDHSRTVKRPIQNDRQLQRANVIVAPAKKKERNRRVLPGNAHNRRLPAGSFHIAVGALPIVALNTVAVMGQLRWASTALTQWGLPGQILFSVACESVALNLCYQEYRAELANDASFGLKIAATLAGLAVGVLNWSHDPHAAIGIVTGTCSALSPWMWRTFTRRASRDKLFRNGQIEGRSIRLGMTRWLWHPYRSFLIKWESTWDGTTNVHAAVTRLDKRLTENAARKAAAKATASMDSELRELQHGQS